MIVQIGFHFYMQNDSALKSENKFKDKGLL